MLVFASKCPSMDKDMWNEKKESYHGFKRSWNELNFHQADDGWATVTKPTVMRWCQKCRAEAYMICIYVKINDIYIYIWIWYNLYTPYIYIYISYHIYILIIYIYITYIHLIHIYIYIYIISNILLFIICIYIYIYISYFYISYIYIISFIFNHIYIYTIHLCDVCKYEIMHVVKQYFVCLLLSVMNKISCRNCRNPVRCGMLRGLLPWRSCLGGTRWADSGFSQISPCLWFGSAALQVSP